VKVLSVRQPWAWCIAVGAKTVENRSRATAYRGPLAIQAGVAEAPYGHADPRVQRVLLDWLGGRSYSDALGELAVRGLGPPWEERGVILAVAELVDCHPDADCCRPWGESRYHNADDSFQQTVVHWVLEDVRPLATPLPWRGALWLQEVPADDEAEIRRRAA
jgi:hypothetical protein